MASPKSRPRDGKPGRALGLILVVAVALAAVMFGTGHKTPRLGIDLAGGTSVTLTATSKDPKAINPSNMQIATNIINERVNAFGVSEATVQTQGNDTILVSIPKGENNQNAADEVGKTAKLYFRPVLAEATSGTASSGSSPSANPSAPNSAKAKPSAGASPKVSASASASKQGKAVSSALEKASATPTGKSSGKSTTAKSSTKASAPASSTASSASSATTSAVAGTVPNGLDKAFTSLDCADKTQRIDYQTSVTADAVACSQNAQNGVWTKYALGPVAVNGDQISNASATLNTQTGAGWQVNLNLKSKGSKQFSDTTAKLATQQSPQNQFAIVMDGQVVSSPYVSSAITGGQAQITGSFTQQDAQNLANVLSFGALPLKFQQSSVNTVSASLGGDQLTVGLVAGGVGLVLVMIYLLLYYRMLGVIAIGSLALTAVLNYEAMVLLGPLMGFTLSLPGIAGAIIAIGITADSFVVFFERLRDELREGRSLRPAVQHGWTRARRTILVSDFVTLLAAVVIYLVTVGDVKGFAFTLGLTTVIDVMVVFLFTKPVVTLVSRRKFFTSGHPWSGVDPQRLGAKKTRSPLGRRLSGRGTAGTTSTEAKEA